MITISVGQRPEALFIPSYRGAQFLQAESQQLCANCWRLRVESLTVQCDLSLTQVSIADANRVNERIRKCFCTTALNGYRSVWRVLSKEQKIEIQPTGLLAKLDQLRAAINDLLGDKGWPTHQAPK